MVLSNPRVSHIKVATGHYTGDGSANRRILTGFKCGAVLLQRVAGGTWAGYSLQLLPGNTLQRDTNGGGSVSTEAIIHATDGFEVDASANETTFEHYWWAIATA